MHWVLYSTVSRSCCLFQIDKIHSLLSAYVAELQAQALLPTTEALGMAPQQGRGGGKEAAYKCAMSA